MFKSNKSLILILLFALIIRITYLFLFVDLNNNNYWEYGYIAENIKSEKGYSLFYFENDTLKQSFNKNAQPYPSAFMSPLYVIYVLPFYYIDEVVIRNTLFGLSQILISIFTIIFLFKLTKLYFGYKAALIASLLVSFIPEYIYIIGIHNAVVQYHFLIILLLYLSIKYDFKNTLTGIIIFSILTSLVIYLRSEFFLFFIMTSLYLFLKRKFKLVLVSVIVLLTLLSSWIIRNEIIFKEFIPFTTSFGLNLYRGHNPVKLGNWGNREFTIEIKELSNGPDFEIVYNRYYTDKALSFILTNPWKELSYTFQKLISLWVININDERSLNILYLFPSLVIMFLSILGLIKTFNKNKFILVYIFLISTTVTSVIFFPLPRYQIMMRIVLIPFCAFYINHIISIFSQRIVKK